MFSPPRLAALLATCGNRWLLPRALAPPHLHELDASIGGPDSVLRDDLLHPLCSGNKLRKLDFIFPRVCEGSTDVVTCGGGQSAHAAAVAVAASERGVAAHLVLRGEPPAILTGYALISRLYATTISYVSRDVYGASADRSAALAVGIARAATFRAAAAPSLLAPPALGTGVIGEGGRDPGALLGLLRLVSGLLAADPTLAVHAVTLVVAAGTGTTAVGLALGAALAGLPWRVVGVPVAATPAALDAAGAALVAGLAVVAPAVASAANELAAAAGGSGTTAARPALLAALPLSWVARPRPRRFGAVLPGEPEVCAAIARRSGVLLDPIYTLAAWEVAAALRGLPPEKPVAGSSAATAATATAAAAQAQAGALPPRIILIHTGGTLGMMGVAQRYPGEFAPRG